MLKNGLEHWQPKDCGGGCTKEASRFVLNPPICLPFSSGSFLSSIHPFCRTRNPGPEGAGGTPVNKLYRYVQPQRVGFLRPFGLKTSIDFAYFGLESSMVF